ncbi:hypothetical protein GcC1_200005 [Golovinomyces cichoracearum]|uniref:Uncharacterized protein n=1 Tax=Golovinomyces cichoracearum TaxID=62708 RepID=A0A420HEI5_9PEZI|nr:hypothetical protein GcC1_200005 [Golovinomyces cichoracearum]
MGNSIGKETELDTMVNDTMDIDNLLSETAGPSRTYRLQESPSSWREMGREEGASETSSTLNEQNLARLIAEQIQLLVASLAAKVNELSSSITTNQPVL